MKYIILKIVGIIFVLQTLMNPVDALASAREKSKFGMGLGVITEPFPSVLGYWAGYNLSSRLRLTAGYSASTVSAVTITTIGADVKFFLFDANFTPFLTAGFSQVTGSTGNGAYSASGSAPIFGLGLFDWQTYLGFNLGIEFKMISAGGNLSGLPGLYFGWYF